MRKKFEYKYFFTHISFQRKVFFSHFLLVLLFNFNIYFLLHILIRKIVYFSFLPLNVRILVASSREVAEGIIGLGVRFAQCKRDADDVVHY